MAKDVLIQTAELLEEIALLNRTVSMLRMEVKVRAGREDELTAKVAQLEGELAKRQPNRAERRRKTQEVKRGQ